MGNECCTIDDTVMATGRIASSPIHVSNDDSSRDRVVGSSRGVAFSGAIFAAIPSASASDSVARRGELQQQFAQLPTSLHENIVRIVPPPAQAREPSTAAGGGVAVTTTSSLHMMTSVAGRPVQQELHCTSPMLSALSSFTQVVQSKSVQSVESSLVLRRTLSFGESRFVSPLTAQSSSSTMLEGDCEELLRSTRSQNFFSCPVTPRSPSSSTNTKVRFTPVAFVLGDVNDDMCYDASASTTALGGGENGNSIPIVAHAVGGRAELHNNNDDDHDDDDETSRGFFFSPPDDVSNPLDGMSTTGSLHVCSIRYEGVVFDESMKQQRATPRRRHHKSGKSQQQPASFTIGVSFDPLPGIVAER